MFRRSIRGRRSFEGLTRRSAAASLCALIAVGATAFASRVPEKRMVTVEDCVRTRRIVPQEVQISEDGTELAYVAKAPNVVTNRNDYILYLRSLRELNRRDNGRPLVTAEDISGIRWLDDGAIAARVLRLEGAQTTDELMVINPSQGSREVVRCPSGTEEYSMSRDGRTIVFAVADKSQETEGTAISASQRLRGYRIAFRMSQSAVPLTNSRIEVFRRMGKRGFKGTKLWFIGPEGYGRRSDLSDIRTLNLSPDGKYLLFRYHTDQLPEDWKKQPLIEQLLAMHSPGAFSVLALCELDSGRIRYAFNFSGSSISKTVWSADSRSYAVISPSPFGSPEGNAEQHAAAVSGNEYYYLDRFTHVFAIDVATGQVTRVASRDSGTAGISEFEFDGPLGWKHSHGTLILRTGINEFSTLVFKDGEWTPENRFGFTEPGMFGSSFASDGETLAGVSQSPSVPPGIAVVDIHSGKRSVLTDLNPDYASIELGEIESIEWTNRYGSQCAGELIKPAGYQEGKRYPFVLMGTSGAHEFITDAPYTTSFAPQSLADAGFVVLLAKYPIDDKVPDGEFPGGMTEAYNWMGMVESAIDLLSSEGLIDKDRVGIVGFSRTSWLTDFTLSHSTYHFQAASSADSGIYTYTEYARSLDMGALLAYEDEMGGPPYGETFKNWVAYAAPFNASHIHAPLLMEYTRVEAAYELFTLLNRQGKPVELYFYPNGHHPLDTPFERVSSLQRNVDWFRFWLQGYERPNPEDPEQYVRWRALAGENR